MFKSGCIFTLSLILSTNILAVDTSLVGKWQSVERHCSKLNKSIPLQNSMTIDINPAGDAKAIIDDKEFSYFVRTFPEANALALVNESSGGFRYSYNIEGDTLLLSAYTFRDNPTGCPADNFQTTIYKRL